MVTVRGTAPTGTVTFLFSDVVGSTRLWAHDQEAMAASLRIHDSIFAETIAKFHGQIFSTAGDSFAAAFERASAAVECALEIQEALSGVSWGTWPALEVRIGLHIGEADERDGNYFGPAVNQAARVMSVAHGGQVVLTDGVRDASGIVATDLGTHQLRDIELPVHLNQLGETSFPPLTSLGIGIVSLPSPRTSLIGREDSVLEVRRLLADHRLVTLAGVGGCGKTRLSIEVAYREIPAYPDGVWFVDLSAIADAVALPGVFATALDIALSSGADPIDQIATYLAARRALLVIDNCEHVIDPVADLVDALLDRCEDLAIIATSREALEVDGEFTWKVPSLATGSDAPAVTLFLERASAAGADLVIDDQTREAVLQVVERLDGIPLAIELAAARSRSMPVTEILELLDDRFNQLSSVTDWSSNQTRFTYDGAGNLTTTTYPNGIVATESYDPASEPTAVTDTNGTSTVASFDYTNTPTGQVATESDTGVSGATSPTYVYDPLHRLTADGTNDYTYNSAGNLTNGPGGINEGYDADGELCYSGGTGSGTCSSPPSSATMYTNSPEGNRLTKTPASGPSTSYSWDQANNLKSVTSGASTTNYTYDGNGLRASEITGSSNLGFVWNVSVANNPQLLSDGINSYIYGPGQTPIEQFASAGTSSYLLMDESSSVRAVSGSDGTIVASMTYDAFGSPFIAGGLTASTPFAFESGYSDRDGLSYISGTDSYVDVETGSEIAVPPDSPHISTSLDNSAKYFPAAFGISGSSVQATDQQISSPLMTKPQAANRVPWVVGFCGSISLGFGGAISGQLCLLRTQNEGRDDIGWVTAASFGFGLAAGVSADVFVAHASTLQQLSGRFNEFTGSFAAAEAAFFWSGAVWNPGPVWGAYAGPSFGIPGATVGYS